MTTSLYSNLKNYITGIRPEFEDKLATLVNIPSISMDPERKGDIQKCADTAVEFLRGIGAKAEAIPTAGNPVVVGEIITDPSYPTVSIYNHMDVQPADASEWNKAPFTLIGTPFSIAYFVANSAVNAGPLSSVVPRPS